MPIAFNEKTCLKQYFKLGGSIGMSGLEYSLKTRFIIFYIGDYKYKDI
jgi:hypothetical protein